MARHSPLAALLRRYAITDVHTFRPLDEGLLNRSFAVHTDAGTLFLKHYLEQAPRVILAQHRATAALAAAGLPVVPPVRDLAGRTVNRSGPRLFALYPWVDGRHRPGLTLDPAQCADLGALLARLHESLAEILGPAPQPLFHPADSAADALATAERLLALVRARPVREGIDDLAEYRLIERSVLLRELAHRRPRPTDRLTLGYVHGDFHGLNILYDHGGSIRSVVDWDKLSVQAYGEELVRSALILFVDLADGRLDLDRVRAYVRGYLSVRPWLAAEMPTAVHRLWWERLTDFWMLSWRYERCDARTDVQFPAASHLIVWWTHRYEKVLDVFRG